MIIFGRHRVGDARDSSAVADQRGLSPAIELVVLAPALMILLGLLVTGARIWFVRSALSEAAYSGARAASIERTTGRAGAVGKAAVIERLRADGADCGRRRIHLDLAGFDTPVGQPSAVEATVRCRIGFGDVLLPGFPGSIWLTGRASAAIDTYRER